MSEDAKWIAGIAVSLFSVLLGAVWYFMRKEHQELKSEVWKVRQWLHMVGRPYLPLAVDDLKKRVDRIE